MKIRKRSIVWALIAAAALLISLFYGAPVEAQGVESVDYGPVHEAYLTPIRGAIILDAISKTPPQPLNERKPAQAENGTEWIEGYWAYVPEESDFVWVSGVWRRPPKGQEWIPGEWKRFDEGFVWLNGFWASKPLEGLNAHEERPPAPLEEAVQDPDGDDYFWMPGYWEWSGSDYKWVSGEWEQFDDEWVYIPAHYEWRPNGYMLIDGYWDWPIDQVGQAYANVIVTDANVVYTPTETIEPLTIVKRLYIYYPTYSCYYQHHYYHHPHWWWGWCCTPPWWAWNTWWTLSWSSQWNLFWWWGHPGFPQPVWLTLKEASAIWSPAFPLFSMLKGAVPPQIITPKGMISAHDLLSARDQVVGSANQPIMPSSARQRQRILQAVSTPPLPGGRILRPTGQVIPMDEAEKAPLARPQIETTTPSARKVTTPARPKTPQPSRPPIRTRRPAPQPTKRERPPMRQREHRSPTRLPRRPEPLPRRAPEEPKKPAPKETKPEEPTRYQMPAPQSRPSKEPNRQTTKPRRTEPATRRGTTQPRRTPQPTQPQQTQPRRLAPPQQTNQPSRRRFY